MKHLLDIARLLSVPVDTLRDLESFGHFGPRTSDSEGKLYDVAEVRGALARTSPVAPLLYFSRLVGAVKFITEAPPRTREIRIAAANYVLDRGNAITKADVAKSIKCSRKHFSLTCKKFREVTGMD